MIELIIIVALIGIGYMFITNKKSKGKKNNYVGEVKRLSRRYSSLLELNEEYSFESVHSRKLKSTFETKLKSKQAFDTYDSGKAFRDYVKANKVSLQPLVQTLYENKVMYADYVKQVEKLPKYGSFTSESDIPHKQFVKIERQLCEELLQGKPQDNVRIKHIWSYTSPKGRNHYANHVLWQLDDFIDLIDRMVKIEGRFIRESEYRQRKIAKKSAREKQLKLERQEKQKRKTQQQRREREQKKQWYIHEIDRVGDISPRYLALKQIHEHYEFLDIAPDEVDVILHEHFDARHKVENYDFNLEDFLRYVYDNKEDLKKLVDKLNVNREIAADYYSEIVDLPPFGANFEQLDTGLSREEFIKVENKLCSEILMQKPVTDMTITYYVTYVSPKGQSQLQKKKTYHIQQIEFALAHVDTYKYAKQRKKKLKSNFVKEQRSIAAGLRYDVLKRDEYRCQICGVKALDGDEIVLHVDHIKPVSKGGESTMENLRTLCQQCNLGKSDKYDPVGVN